jgi:hypothetical protein
MFSLMKSHTQHPTEEVAHYDWRRTQESRWLHCIHRHVHNPESQEPPAVSHPYIIKRELRRIRTNAMVFLVKRPKNYKHVVEKTPKDLSCDTLKNFLSYSTRG